MTSPREVPADPFHEHLDACDRCRESPFDLCDVGAKALGESMKKLNEELGYLTPINGWVPPARGPR